MIAYLGVAGGSDLEKLVKRKKITATFVLVMCYVM